MSKILSQFFFPMVYYFSVHGGSFPLAYILISKPANIILSLVIMLKAFLEDGSVVPSTQESRGVWLHCNDCKMYSRDPVSLQILVNVVHVWFQSISLYTLTRFLFSHSSSNHWFYKQNPGRYCRRISCCVFWDMNDAVISWYLKCCATYQICANTRFDE